MLKRSGIFKKVLTADSGTATGDPALPPVEAGMVENTSPFTRVHPQASLPPQRPKKRQPTSHDPFDDEDDFGYIPEDAPATPPPSPKKNK